MGYNHIKHRFYTGEFYFDDLTYNELCDSLKGCLIPSCISPIHDKDIYTQSDIDKYKERNIFDSSRHIVGGFKKSHCHVIFYMPYPKQPKSSLSYINSNLPKNLQLNYIQGVGFPVLMNRYLCHLDNPEKFQYSTCLIRSFHDYPLDLSKPSPPRTQRNCLKELISFINSNDNITITRLIGIFVEDDDMSRFIIKNTYFVNCLLKDKRGF